MIRPFRAVVAGLDRWSQESDANVKVDSPSVGRLDEATKYLF